MITIESLKSYQDNPDRLLLLCLQEIIKKQVNLCRYTLPPELGDLIAVAFRDYAIANQLPASGCVNFFKNFKHKYIPLSRINFSGLPIGTRFFMDFLEEYKDQLDEINISNCNSLDVYYGSRQLNRLLKCNSNNPKSLIIGDTFTPDFSRKIEMGSEMRLRGFDSDLKLKKLVLHMPSRSLHVDEFTSNMQLSLFLTPTMSNSLKYLDLSTCFIGKGSALMQLESLEILILYHCQMTYPDVISTICQLKKLRVLDLSQPALDTDVEHGSAVDDPNLLDLLVNKLPQLTRLDISGTNLVGGKDRNISAFEARMDRPFEFLGLFHTVDDAAFRSCIPAITVAGEATESQILNACEAYIDRPGQLSKALNDLYNFYKTITPSETFNGINRALDIILRILTRHLSDQQVIVSTTAALWCTVKLNITLKDMIDARVRRSITSRLLDVMIYHKTCRIILINGGLTLIFLPDIICDHSRVAEITLVMCRDPDSRTQGFGITLLNQLACQVGGDQKIYIGKLNAIETMIDIIKTKLEQNACDEVLETAWSTLWNVTDETPVNCQRFLEYHGLEAFESCMDKFGNNKEVLKNVMGLLGNVAECQKLRINFMEAKYIDRFSRLLSSTIDGIECSYNACGILAHLISEGPKFWEEHLPKELSREALLEKIRSAISRWPINSRRNINYRSFEPIVRLLDTSVAPEAQYWAVFALTNLTRINPAKYCPMLLPYDGLVKLRRLAEPGVAEEYVGKLARIACYQYQRFETEATLAGLEQCDSVDFQVVYNFRADPNGGGDGTSEMGEGLH